MDILRNLFGNLAAGIIRLLVAVGILFAAYIFILKPILKTTDNAINAGNSAFEKSLGTEGLDSISHTLEDVSHQVQVEVQRSFHSARRHGSPKRLVRCIEHAHGDVPKIRRCTVKF